MYYEYLCDTCGESTLLQLSMKEDIPQKTPCGKCGKEACRVWSNTTIQIPDHMRAISDINDGGYADFDHLKSKFKNAKRPSGKEKIYY